MDEEPTGSFITALLELKLDKDTMFEWQKASQDSKKTPHYDDLLKFLDLRAQTSETCSSEPRRHHHQIRKPFPKSAASFVANSQSPDAPNCSICKTQKHPLYACPQFKLLPHDKMLSTVRSSNVCLNCLKPGHFSKNCGSNNRCKKCQKPHHTLLHRESAENKEQSEPPSTESSALAVAPMVSSYAQSGSGTTLLMTCQMFVNAVYLTQALLLHSYPSDWLNLSNYHCQLRTFASLASLVCLADLPCNQLPRSQSQLCATR